MKNAKFGESHHMHKLTLSEVLMIRSLHESVKLGYKKLSKLFGVSVRTIRDIVSYRTWCN